jgi:hypothetical protein
VFPLDTGGTGRVFGASYSLVVVVSVTWWVVEQLTKHNIAKPTPPAIAAFAARFIDLYSYSLVHRKCVSLSALFESAHD